MNKSLELKMIENKLLRPEINKLKKLNAKMSFHVDNLMQTSASLVW